jgi:hypothetical protein
VAEEELALESEQALLLQVVGKARQLWALRQ